MARLPLSVIDRCSHRLPAARIIDSPRRCVSVFLPIVYCVPPETATLSQMLRPGIEKPGGHRGASHERFPNDAHASQVPGSPRARLMAS